MVLAVNPCQDGLRFSVMVIAVIPGSVDSGIQFFRSSYGLRNQHLIQTSSITNNILCSMNFQNALTTGQSIDKQRHCWQSPGLIPVSVLPEAGTSFEYNIYIYIHISITSKQVINHMGGTASVLQLLIEQLR